MKQALYLLLCGGKQRIEGHHLRHRLHKRENEITIPKQWYYTFVRQWMQLTQPTTNRET